jgi:hypothetical protein
MRILWPGDCGGGDVGGGDTGGIERPTSFGQQPWDDKVQKAQEGLGG